MNNANMDNQPTAINDIYISFFLFTTDMKPDDEEYQKTVVKHIKELQKYGYKGFEFPIAPPSDTPNYPQDLTNYTQLRNYLNSQGLADVKIATNVGATRTFDPSSPYSQQREEALKYLK